MRFSMIVCLIRYQMTHQVHTYTNYFKVGNLVEYGEYGGHRIIVMVFDICRVLTVTRTFTKTAVKNPFQ